MPATSIRQRSARNRGSGSKPTSAPSTSAPTTRASRIRKRAHSPTTGEETSHSQKKPRGNPKSKNTQMRRAPPIPEDSDSDVGDEDEFEDVVDKHAENEDSDEEDEGLSTLESTQARSLLSAEMVRIRHTPESEASIFLSTSLGPASEADDVLSKRNEQYHSEVPRITSDQDLELSSCRSSEPLSRHNSEQFSQEHDETPPPSTQPRKSTGVNAGWPIEAHYTPKDGARLISLRAQPAPLQKLLTQGEYQATKMCLEQSFFIIHDTEFTTLTSLLIDVAEKANLRQLAIRLKKDRPFYQECGRMLSQRLALRRSRVKSIAAPLVGIKFGFEDSKVDPDWIKKTANMLLQEAKYILPVEDGVHIKTRPYEHPAIIRTLSKYLFNETSRRATIGELHSDIFKSSLPRFPDQCEIPLSLIALAATAVHNAISDWTSGFHHPSDFASDIVEDVFTGHKGWLESVKEMKPGIYHAMAHRIYKQCRTTSAVGHGVKTEISNLVDLDGMEEAM